MGGGMTGIDPPSQNKIITTPLPPRPHGILEKTYLVGASRHAFLLLYKYIADEQTETTAPVDFAARFSTRANRNAKHKKKLSGRCKFNPAALKIGQSGTVVEPR